jgi:hypothetical protein
LNGQALAERILEPTTHAAVEVLAALTTILPSTSTGRALGLTVPPSLLFACTDEAIEAAARTRQMCERQKQAVQRLWDEMREAEQQIEKLQKRVGEAVSRHCRGCGDGGGPPASGVSKAKKAVETGTNHLDALKAARAEFNSRLEALARRLAISIEVAAVLAIRGEINGLIDQSLKVSPRVAFTSPCGTGLGRCASWRRSSPVSF